jgi:pimeloyl-ACP methyl ester carboxylesterase
MDRAVLGSVVLVHGLWGNPQDWLWVSELIEHAGAVVVAPDLPSHRYPQAGLLEDADEVRAAIRAAVRPVVVAGWSYGGTVISIAADGEQSVTRLVYVSNVPSAARDFGFTDWIDEDPEVITYEDGTFVLDNEWWLNEEAGTTFPPEVLSHLRHHPRRRASRKSMSDPQPTTAWRSIPSTVVLGRLDDQPGANDVEGAAAKVPDVRVLECDHFTIFREPASVARAILDGFQSPRPP